MTTNLNPPDPALTDPTIAPEDQVRAAASDANLAGIVAGRRAAARSVLAANPEPGRLVRQGWEPIRQAKTGDVINRANKTPQPRLAPTRAQLP